MRKSLFLASLLFASSSFSLQTCTPTGTPGTPAISPPTSPSIFNNATQVGFVDYDYCSSWPDNPCTSWHIRVQTFSCSYTANCSAGSTANAQGYCVADDCGANTKTSLGCAEIPFPSPPPPPVTGLHANDGNPSGCDSVGGYYMGGSCNTLQEAVQATFGDPQAVKGAYLAIGGAGVALTGVGLLGASFGASATMISAGAHAMVAGFGMIATATPKVTGGTSSASNDMTSGSSRIKVNLTSTGGAGGTSSGSNVTSTNTTTGKVDNSTFVPASVQTALSNSANVTSTADSASLTTPISLAGVQSTNYDYATNTATTEYHLADSTSAVPHTATSTTSFSVTQNIDGTVTTVPTNTDLAPTVSGSGGGLVVSAPTATGGGTTTGTTIGTGTTTGTGGEYTAVLNDIKTNTSGTKSTLDSILSMFDNSTAVDTTLNDGSGDFGTLDGNAKSAIDGFVFTDPLGLNNIATQPIDTYAFNILGHNFVLFDQSMLNSLPLDLIRNMMLFIFAILGFIVVFKTV